MDGECRNKVVFLIMYLVNVLHACVSRHVQFHWCLRYLFCRHGNPCSCHHPCKEIWGGFLAVNHFTSKLSLSFSLNDFCLDLNNWITFIHSREKNTRKAWKGFIFTFFTLFTCTWIPCHQMHRHDIQKTPHIHEISPRSRKLEWWMQTWFTTVLG